jgi:hypothetical protein
MSEMPMGEVENARHSFRQLSASSATPMERPMENQKHERFLSANQELRAFLRRARDVARGIYTISEADLQSLSRRLSNCGYSVGEASRSETLDADLRSEIAEYVRNLRAIQKTLEKVRGVLQARRKRLETTEGRFAGLHGWAGMYSHDK